MGVASGCGEQDGSGWNLWVWLLGVVLRRYIDFLILLIPTPLVSVLFCSSIPTFLFIKKKCFSFFIYILVRSMKLCIHISIYIYNIVLYDWPWPRGYRVRAIIYCTTGLGPAGTVCRRLCSPNAVAFSSNYDSV